jgi:hypothetical protein
MVQIYSIVRFELSNNWGKLTMGPQVVAKPKIKKEAKLLSRISNCRVLERSEEYWRLNKRGITHQIIAIPE